MSREYGIASFEWVFFPRETMGGLVGPSPRVKAALDAAGLPARRPSLRPLAAP
jgi:hypothetical protein